MIESVRGWVRAASPQVEHLERTLDWTLELAPDASESLRVAALAHDMERAYPEGSPAWEPARGWDDRLYTIAHCERSARIVGDHLRDALVPEAEVREVVRLILVHEDGGWAEADVLQAADSLSFLETMPAAVAGWVRSGRTTEAQARDRLRHAVERIRHQAGRRAAAGLLPEAERVFEQALAGG